MMDTDMEYRFILFEIKSVYPWLCGSYVVETEGYLIFVLLSLLTCKIWATVLFCEEKRIQYIVKKSIILGRFFTYLKVCKTQMLNLRKKQEKRIQCINKK